MASKRRRSYRGTPEEHAQDAASILSEMRSVVKRAVLHADNGDCGEALLDYGLAQRKMGGYSVSKAYSLHRLSSKPRRAQNVLSATGSIGRVLENARKAVDACYHRRTKRK